MIITGIGDEAAGSIDEQIKAHQQLGWKWIEMRGVEVEGFPKGNFHEIPPEAFARAFQLVLPDGRALAALRDGKLVAWDPDGGDEPRVLVAEGPVLLALSPDLNLSFLTP